MLKRLNRKVLLSSVIPLFIMSCGPNTTENTMADMNSEAKLPINSDSANLNANTLLKEGKILSTTGCPANLISQGYTNCSEPVIQDNSDSSFSKDWNYLTRTRLKKQIHNNELEDYLPSQVSYHAADGADFDQGLNLLLEKESKGNYKSAAVITKKALTDLAPIHGYMEITVQLPHKPKFDDESKSSTRVMPLGLWPAIWAIPDSKSTIQWPQSGEIDFMELMAKDPSKTSFSTLHFGPGDFTTDYKGGQGLRIQEYTWANTNTKEGQNTFTYNSSQTFGYEWHKIPENPNTPSYWQIAMYVNGEKKWTVNMKYTNNQFLNQYLDSGYTNGTLGDPVSIFNAALDNKGVDGKSGPNGFHLKVNLAFGGLPFIHSGVDENLNRAVMSIQSFKVWNLGATTPATKCSAEQIPQNLEFDCKSENEFKYTFSGLKLVKSIHITDFNGHDFPVPFNADASSGSVDFTDSSTGINHESICNESAKYPLTYHVSYTCEDQNQKIAPVTLSVNVKR